MPNLLLVMAGGALGAGARYHLGRVAMAQLGPAFPWGTWLVNLLGGFLAGILLGVLLHEGPAMQPVRLFFGVGLLGGFTTFSAFTAETADMLQRGELAMAGAYAISSVAGSLVLLFLGLWLARAVA